MKYTLFGEESKRLIFRKLEDSDFETWQALFERKEVATFLAQDPSKSSKELCEAWFKRCYERYEKGTGGMNVLIDKASGDFIGQCGLLMQTIEGEEAMEIGYSMLPKHWGKGYASEAAQYLKDYAFNKGYRDYLVSCINVDNIASETVARKNGMHLWKYLEDYKGIPANIFRITKEEWEKQ